MGLPFPFSPRSLNEWCSLSELHRRVWLTSARDRCFDPGSDFVPTAVSGREIILAGGLVDSLLGFYCAVGEAVNGPGGYFGRSLQSFDDCLFGGFGLEFPYTIVWRDSARSRAALGSSELLKYLEDEEQQTREAALAGERTLFEEIVEAIRTVPERGGGVVTLILE